MLFWSSVVVQMVTSMLLAFWLLFIGGGYANSPHAPPWFANAIVFSGAILALSCYGNIALWQYGRTHGWSDWMYLTHLLPPILMGVHYAIVKHVAGTFGVEV